MSLFKKAERKRAFLKLAVTGPSGAGKSFSSLLIASGMGKRIAVIDTENGSASLYSEKFNFDVIEISPPFTTEKYISAIHAATAESYDVLVIDSLFHAWKGEGGILEQKEAMDQRPGANSYANWGKMTPVWNRLIQTILQSKIHIISTMRSKQDCVLEERNGKKVPVKVGLNPEIRDGLEYEFSTVLDIAMNHQAVASKDRTGMFPTDVPFKITEATGEKILAWLNSGKAPDPEPVAPPPGPATAPPKLDPLEYKFDWGTTPDKRGLKGLTLNEAINGRPENAETETVRFDGIGLEGVKKYLENTNAWLEREKKPKFHGLAIAERKFAEYEASLIEEIADGWSNQTFDDPNGLDAALARNGAK